MKGDEQMEVWKDIEGFPGYQVSNRGNVRTFWKRKHRPTGYGTFNYISDIPSMMSPSDDGNGYLKVMLYCSEDGRRYCKKIHRLVAEAFLTHSVDEDTVDHILSGPNGKMNNSVDNLRWISRRENIQKAYKDGVCDRRIANQKKGVIAIDLWIGKEHYFPSIGDAAECLGVDRSAISHVLRGDYNTVNHYTFEYATREEDAIYGTDENYKQLPWI